MWKTRKLIVVPGWWGWREEGVYSISLMAVIGIP